MGRESQFLLQMARSVLAKNESSEVIMTKKKAILALIMSAVSLISASQLFAQNWPGWRGDGHGISPEKNLPLKWMAQRNGHSTMPALRWRFSEAHQRHARDSIKAAETASVPQ